MQGEVKMVSSSIPSANEQAKYLILIKIVQLKPMIKAQISGIMVSNCIRYVATAQYTLRKPV